MRDGPHLASGGSHFQSDLITLFGSEFPRLFRFLNRLSGDPELAEDLAQDAFIRLVRRGSMPDSPTAWLITVALNLHRNAQAKRSRRARLLSVVRAQGVHSDPGLSPAEKATTSAEARAVRSALDSLPSRERHLLLLRAEGFGYREMAEALSLNSASVGTLLARAKKLFREKYLEGSHAP